MAQTHAQRLIQLLAIDDCQRLLSELYKFVLEAPSGLSPIEEEAYLLLSLLPEIEINGFDSLFYQHYTLRQCDIVETVLRKTGLVELAALFGEAKAIYVRGRADMTDELFRELEPFTLDHERGRRFDEIAEKFLRPGSEIYQSADPMCRYFRAALREHLRTGE